MAKKKALKSGTACSCLQVILVDLQYPNSMMHSAVQVAYDTCLQNGLINESNQACFDALVACSALANPASCVSQATSTVCADIC